MEAYRNPIPTVDIIIEVESDGIVLVKRRNPPHGWAIPGGFVDYVIANGCDILFGPDL